MFSTILRATCVACGLAGALAGCAAPPQSAGMAAPGRENRPEASIDERYWTADDRHVVVDGVRLRIREQGRRNAPVVVLVHGFSFSLESWDDWAADLARDHRVIRYDLAGHGLSDADPRQRYDTAARVKALVALLDHLGIRRATLVGNSFGGLISWRLAAAHPDRVARLVLVDSAAFSINGVTDTPVPVPAATRAFLLAPTPAAVRFAAGLIFSDPAGPSPGRLAMMQDMIARPGNGAALVSHLEQFTLPPPAAELARVRAPTLILWGEADRLIPVTQAEQLAAAIPGATLIRYPGVGHAPQEEIPDRSLADVRRFLARTSKP